MKWFNNPKTIEELKKEYKKLAIKHHPDVGGTDSDMKEINAEYDILFEKLKNIHTSATGETYESKEEVHETPEEFREIISKLITLSGIQIEICGSWLWITGDTFPHKDQLKALKFRWAKAKSAWYWYNDEDYHKKSKKTFSLDEIRDLFGSEKVATQRVEALA